MNDQISFIISINCILLSFIQQSHIEYPLHTTLCYDPGGTDVNKTKVPAKMEFTF